MPMIDPSDLELPGTWLEIDDGAILKPVGWGGSKGVLDYIDFGGLPENVEQVTLVRLKLTFLSMKET